MNPMQQAQQLGQAMWFDYIRRGRLAGSGGEGQIHRHHGLRSPDAGSG